MSELRWDEFPEIPSTQWKQKIQAGLKGADYNKTLIWNTNEGIDVKPFYTREDTVGLSPFFNSNADWKICQNIYAGNTKQASAKALDVLERGAESLLFILPSEDINIAALLQDIGLNTIPIYVQLELLSADLAKKLSTFASGENTRIYMNTDIIGNLARSGNWYFNLEKDHKELAKILNHTANLQSVIAVDSALYQNAGANMVQQLAYALAHANEYCNFITQSNAVSDQATSNFNIHFKTAVGSNYFFEIAKLRALRLLWATLASEYNLPIDCHISAQPTKRNKTLYDYNVNMLRTTTACMSAVLGGADTIYNLAYDAIYHKDNEFGERIARNQLLILKNESYFDKVSNPADGAYYIESITAQLAKKALDTFKQIEAGGGFLKQLKSHSIQNKIKESAAAEQQQFNNMENVLIGTNKYPNESDTMKHDLELYPFVKTNVRKTLIEPIIEKRLAEAMEQERLKQE